MKYVCELCGFVYDEEIGDPGHGIAAGTPFAELPVNFGCRCGSEKEAFCKVAPKSGTPAAKVKRDAEFDALKYGDSPIESQR